MYCSFIVSRVQCISLRSTQSPIYQSLTLEGTLCLISTPGCDAWFYLVCTLPSGVPSWFPLVPSDWGICVSPLETDQESCPGWLPSVPLDLVSSQEGFSPGPVTPRFEHFPAWYTVQNLYAKPSTDWKILLTICLVPRPYYSVKINDQF